MNKRISSLFLLLFMLSITSCIHRKTEDPLSYYLLMGESEDREYPQEQLAMYYMKIEEELQAEIQQLEKQAAPIAKIEPLLKERNELRAKIERIEQKLLGSCRGYIDITSNPLKARIFINKEEQEPKTPAKFRASCGSYTVMIKKDCKYRDNPRKVIVEEKKTTRVCFIKLE